MASNLDRVLKLEVPVIVRLGERRMSLGEVLGFVPGMIIEIPKDAEGELELLVNNKPIGSGAAVKVGENFGLKLTFIGDVAERAKALAALPGGGSGNAPADSAEAMADAILAGQR